MELKRIHCRHNRLYCNPLIVPYGIETLDSLVNPFFNGLPLIVPYGIETRCELVER